jgi:predicted tellurium resistance membrane protein TerC
MDWITNPQAWIALATLTALEIVLGIDNIIFISVLVGRLPKKDRGKARFLGLGLAMLMRILLLLSITWIMRLTSPFFSVLDQEISGRDIILIGGGLFLLWKSTHEIHNSLEGEEERGGGKVTAAFGAVLVQIALLDIVFSLDSVITAVGLAKDVAVMVISIVLAVIVMMFSSRAIGDFVDRHPTIKVLALSFLVVVGVALVAEGFDWHIPRGYIYFSMAFSVVVEMLNIRMRKKAVRPVKLHKPIKERS